MMIVFALLNLMGVQSLWLNLLSSLLWLEAGYFCKLFYSWHTGPDEQGHSIHQGSMRTTGTFPDTPSLLWGQKVVHKIKLYAWTAVCLDSQLIYTWGCLAVVHNLNHSGNNHAIRNPSGLQRISVGTGHFENEIGTKFRQLLFSRISTNITVS